MAMDQGEAKGRAALQRAKEFLREEEPLSAIGVLSEFMGDRRVRGYNAVHAEVTIELIRICLEQRLHAPVQQALTNFRRRATNIDPAIIERVAKTAIDGAVKLAEDAVKQVEKVEASEASALEYLRLVSGRGVTGAASAILERRIIEPAFQFLYSMTEAVLFASSLIEDRNTKKFSGKNLVMFYQQTAQGVIKVFQAYKRSRELDSLCRHLKRNFYDKLISNFEFVEAVGEKEDHITALITTRHEMLKAATELRLWRTASNIIADTNDVTRELIKRKKPQKRQLYIAYYVTLAKLFAACELPAFHAYCVMRVARMSVRAEGVTDDFRALIASQAVLAVLSVDPDAISGTISQNHDRDADKTLQLARSLGLPAAPLRSSLLIEALDIIEFVHPYVRSIYDSLLNVSSINICRDIKPQLEKAAAVPALATYTAQLKKVGVMALLDVVSSAFATMPLDYFVSLAAFYTADEFYTVVEPVILTWGTAAASGNVVEIDMERRALNFMLATSRAEERVVSFSQQLQDVIARINARNVVAAAVAPTPAATGYHFSAEELENQRDRLRARAILAAKRAEAERDREERERKREQKRRQDEIDRIKKIEEQRHRESLDRARKALEQEVAELEAVERRKWVLKALAPKNKGLDIPLTLANLSADKFADEVSRRLAQHRHATEARKDSDLRTMDHLERAIREEEIPRREQLAKDAAEAEAKLRDETVANLLAKHKADHERAVETKKRLAQLEAARRAEEAAVLAREGKAGKTKREQQEDLLRQEKEARAREAAAVRGSSSSAPAAAPAAAAAAAPATSAAPAASAPAAASADAPASTPAAAGGEAPATAAPAKAAWKPKSRQ